MSGYAVIDTPVGAITLTATDAGLHRIRFDRHVDEGHPDGGMLSEAADQLAAYFAGERQRFDLPLDPPRLTAFQRAVLEAMAEVPYGALTTYGELARQVDRPKASRAVGGVCNANPLPIVWPCHRVIASDGSLGGYATGTSTKRRLLELERGAAIPPGGWEPAALLRAGPADAPRLFEV
ncbi:MAG: methylated-DNA--[protein]-cysteine S-methyltransferase [Nitriliruptorales bacterium]|nr:methylated-DNA--[protein]-cysteine S-methyltransferase [Nitriliruptorales bacterium]